MNYEEALAKLETWADGDGKAIAVVIRDHVTSTDKEASAWKSKFNKADAQVKRLNDLLGEEGKDATETLGNWKKQVTKLEESVATLTKERDNAVSQVSTIKLSRAVESIGVNAIAFERFIEKGLLDGSKITVEGDNKVLFEGKPFKDYAESQGKWMVAALFQSDDDGHERQNDNTSNTTSTGTGEDTGRGKGNGGVLTGGTKSGKKQNDTLTVAKAAIANLGYKFPS